MITRISLALISGLVMSLAGPALANPDRQCMDLFKTRVTAPELQLSFDVSSQDSIISSIAAIPLHQLRGPISQVMRPAEAFLRGDSKARRLIISQLNGLHANPGKRYTVEHSWAVAALSVKIGKAVGMTQNELVTLLYSGLGHDLGKSIVPDEILNKPDKLTDEEFKLMKHHAVALKLILMTRASEDPELAVFMEAGADHHERWDGKGYPNGKAGEQISLPSRIIAIADTFHAMISDRPYRKGMPMSKVLEILTKEINSGQFDPKVLEQFLPFVATEEK